ncbi:MAG: type 1 glutamine amidotransferase family protein, partial [Thermoguttaceae bacterium]
MNATARLFLALLLLQGLPDTARADGRVEVELAMEERGSITGQQEWLQRLSQAGLSGFRIRSAEGGEVPNIQRRGTDDAPLYAVTGIITADNVVVLPGARFQATQIGQLAQWLKDLAEMGPADQRPARA